MLPDIPNPTNGTHEHWNIYIIDQHIEHTKLGNKNVHSKKLQ